MPGKKILVIDEDEVTNRFISTLLTDGGYEVTSALSAEQALDMNRQHQPSLVLGDLFIPSRAGSALIAALLDQPNMARVPLIILSLRDREEDVVRGLEAGADDYIVKPFNARELLVRVRKQLCRPKLDD
jgi:DNA-binding response OmpR family regulator